MNYKLKALEEKGTPIRTAIVGAGQMGRGLVGQMAAMKGMVPAILVDHTPKKAIHAFTMAGIHESDILVVKNVSEANSALERGKYIVTDDSEIATKLNLIDAVVDATGVPEAGAKIAIDSINNGKHICMLNVETDVCIGHLLHKLATNAGVVYTGSAGDEPGAVMELFDFADAAGFTVRVVGKGKNNKVDKTCTPQTVLEEATRKGITPKMLCSFKDGTKTMVEMTAMANATGFLPDIMGAHGASGSVKELPQILSLKSEGGILDNYSVVEYVNGVAPGVFVIITTDLPYVKHELNYLKMGEGPNYILYRPYHLCSLETPLTVAKAVIDKEATLIPRCGKVAETIAVAKKNLKTGEFLDGIGEYTVYGTFAKAQDAKKLGAVPIGIINKNTRMVKDCKKGEIITYDMLALDNDSMVVNLRKVQDSLFI